MTHPTSQSAQLFEATVSRRVQLPYLLHLPEAARPGKDAGRRWPLLLFLHGAGERGVDLERLKKHGVPKMLERPGWRWASSFVVISPQCPRWSWWTAELEGLSALLDDALARYPVDPERVYLSGLSMGGYGTWLLAATQPERFAAIAPVCGGGDPEQACALAHTPIWAFHGARDEVVPLRESEEMVRAVRACGGAARLTVYPKTGHNAWTHAYRNPKLYAWLLEQRRPQ